MNLKQALMFLAVFSCLLSHGQIAQANLIQNGSFENSPPFSSSHTFYPLDNDLQYWTVVSGDIDVCLSSIWQPADGNASVDMNGWDAGSISQEFPTIVGHQYQVEFALAANNNAPSPAYLQVSAASVSQVWSVYPTGSTINMGWDDQSFIFTANSTKTSLVFTSLTSGASGPAIDNVRATDLTSPTPEPSTILLMGIAIAGLVCTRTRRRKNIMAG